MPLAPTLGRVSLSPAALAAIHADPMDRFRAWLDKPNPRTGRPLSPHTRRAYEAGIRAFGSWLTGSGCDAVEQVGAVLSLILADDAGATNRAIDDWRDALAAEPMRDDTGGVVLGPKGQPAQRWSAATINARLAAVLSLARHASACGLTGVVLARKLLGSARRQDRSGPSRDDVAALLDACCDGSPAGLRDAAMIRLAHNVGLRRHEVVNLALADVELEHADGAILRVLGKGRSELEPVRLDPATATSIRRWLEARGTEPGPLFVRLNRGTPAGELHPMTGEAFRRVLIARARRVGIRRPVRPHGLRHRGATEVARLRPSVAALKAWGRWSSLESARHYLDNLAAEQAAAAVAIAL